ncbi:MAG: hypothetical protein AAGI53_17370 [Planctomycetota bacterium]
MTQTFFAIVAAGSASAGQIGLGSTMNADSFISEDSITGSFARIGLGDGSLGDADGLYDIADINNPTPPTTPFFPLDVFPREADFVVGDLDFDAAAVSGAGVETAGVTNLDLSELWASDPTRIDPNPTTAPSVVSDISDRALGLWFFGAPGAIEFGSLDASDTVTFTDGVLTSIDVSITADFSIDASGAGAPTVWSGTFSISGDAISFQVNDTQNPFIPSTIVIDLTGRVDAVGSFVIPTPAGALSFLAGAALVARRRR